MFLSNVFISLERIAELREIESDGDYWKVGSSVLLREFAQRFIDKFLSIFCVVVVQP